MIKTPRGLKIKKCSHGQGLFAVKNFKSGQLIGEIVGGKVVRKPSDASMFALKVPKKNLWWDEIDIKKIEWDSFLDHSENPNAEILFNNFSPKKPKAKLIALQEIRRDKEITINYHDYGDRLYKVKRHTKNE